MEYRWYSLSIVRTETDFSEAFSRDREHVFAGTPLRTTVGRG